MAPKRGKEGAEAELQQGRPVGHNSRIRPLPASNPFAILEPDARVTSTHVYFHHGILSNWYLSSPDFPGARCFEILLPVLDEQEIPHPAPNALSSRLMSDHMFNCGEQWMMAMKGWIFERHIELSERRVDVSEDESTEDFMGRKEYEALRTRLLAGEQKAECISIQKGEMYRGTICNVLRSKHPRDQKAHGRNASRFNDYTWKEASIASTIAACIARAELDINLRKLYLACADKSFVEGSASDVKWGVGISWKKPQIEDETLWRGENRLGRCHDEAARSIRETDGGNNSRMF